jgi:uncharacterized membrane protein
MWQSYALGSLVAGALESIADKAGIVHDAAVDSYVATFYRVALFTGAVALLGASGLFGDFRFFFHWSLVLLGFLAAISSLLFTYLLRHLEITVIGALSYLAPFLFLGIDMYILGAPLTAVHIAGMVLLVGGAIAFTLEGKTHHFKRALTWRVGAALFFMTVVYAGCDAYLFTYLNASHGLEAVSYSASAHVFNGMFLFGLIIARGRLPRLFDRSARRYIPYAAIGKSFDSLNSILFLMALPLATVSQVTAFTALSPLVLFVVAALSQNLFRFGLDEHLRAGNTPWKLGAAIVLVIGGLLVA